MQLKKLFLSLLLLMPVLAFADSGLVIAPPLNNGGTITGPVHIFNTDPEAFLVGKTADAGDVFDVNTTTGGILVTGTTNTSGVPTVATFTGAANTGMTLSTEVPGLLLDFSATKQWATGALTTQREILAKAPTYGFVGASTITNAATIGVSGAPIAGTNATLTNSHAILVQGSAVTSGTTNSFGLTVNAQTGATNNFASQFLSGGSLFSASATAPTKNFSTNGGTITPLVSIMRDVSSASFSNLALYKHTDTGTRSNNLSFVSSRGTNAAPTALVSGDNAGILNFYGYNGTDYEQGGSIQVSIDGTPTSSVGGPVPMQLLFNTQRDGAALGVTTALSLSNIGDFKATSRTNSVNLTASTELVQFDFSGNSQRHYGTGTLALQRTMLIRPPAYYFDSASTVTTAASLALLGMPTVGTNATITNTIGFLVGDPVGVWATNVTGTNMSSVVSIPAISSGTTNVTELSGFVFTNMGVNLASGDTTGTTTNEYGARFDSVTLTSTGARTITNPTTLYIAGPFVAGSGVTFTNTSYAMRVAAGPSRFDDRILGSSAAITAANNLTLGASNQQIVAGATTINAITTAGWTAGSTVTLVFSAAPTVKHNTAGGAGTAKILLAGSADFLAAANSTLTLQYDGTQWQEISRKAP